MSGPQTWTAPGSPLPSQEPPERPDDATAGTASAAGTAPALPAADTSPPAESATERADLLGGDIPFRPLGISEILDGSIACIRRHPRAVLGLSLAITSVIQVLISLGGYLLFGDQEELSSEPLTESVGAQFTLSLLGLALSAYGTLLMTGLLAPVVSRTLFDRPASLRQTWRDTRPVFGRLLATAGFVLLASLLAGVVPLLPFIMLLAADGPPVAGVLAAVVGFPLSLGVTIWLYVLWVLAVPALVLERQTAAEALRRAIQLSRARWWRTCGTLLLALIITVFMGFLALRLPFLFLQLVLFGDGTDGGGALLGSLAVDTLGRIVSWGLITPFDAGVIALLYIDRRMRREGFDLDVQTRSRDEALTRPLDVWRPVHFPPTNYPPPGPGRPLMPYASPPGYPPQVPGPPYPGAHPHQHPGFPARPGAPTHSNAQPYPGAQPPPGFPPPPSAHQYTGQQPGTRSPPNGGPPQQAHLHPGVHPPPGAHPQNMQPPPGTHPHQGIQPQHPQHPQHPQLGGQPHAGGYRHPGVQAGGEPPPRGRAESGGEAGPGVEARMDDAGGGGEPERGRDDA